LYFPELGLNDPNEPQRIVPHEIVVHSVKDQRSDEVVEFGAVLGQPKAMQSTLG
jgi:hypothetical protein